VIDRDLWLLGEARDGVEEPFYDVSGNNKGSEWGVKLSLTLLFPE
jgi:hypothetical protein